MSGHFLGEKTTGWPAQAGGRSPESVHCSPWLLGGTPFPCLSHPSEPASSRKPILISHLSDLGHTPLSQVGKPHLLSRPRPFHMQGPAGGRCSIKRVEWDGEVTMTNSHPDTAFPFCFPGWGTGERGTSGVLVSRGLAPRGQAHLCTAAWTRCRRAVQSLPPLKPTQSWLSRYRSRAVSMVCRALSTFFPREEPAGQVGRRPLSTPCDTYGRQCF